MEKIYFDTLKETLYHEKMDNGLEVYLLPKQGFEKTYGLFSTKFGAIDTTFVPLNGNEMIKVEDGIAHFLEHKMFDMNGTDASDEFAKLIDPLHVLECVRRVYCNDSSEADV